MKKQPLEALCWICPCIIHSMHPSLCLFVEACSWHLLDTGKFSGKELWIENICFNRFIRFRQKQDMNVSGLSNSARMKRRNRNLVTIKFHLFNWILETLSTFIVIILNLNRFSTLIYIFTMSWGTPLVYFMGIEENRKMAQEHFRANMRVFSKSKDSTENTKLKKKIWQQEMGQTTWCKKIKRLALLLAILVIVVLQPIYFCEFGRTPSGTLEVKTSKNFTTQVDKPCGKESPDTVDIE